MKPEDGSGDAPKIQKDAPATTDSNPPAGQLLCCICYSRLGSFRLTYFSRYVSNHRLTGSISRFIDRLEYFRRSAQNPRSMSYNLYIVGENLNAFTMFVNLWLNLANDFVLIIDSVSIFGSVHIFSRFHVMISFYISRWLGGC